MKDELKGFVELALVPGVVFGYFVVVGGEDINHIIILIEAVYFVAILIPQKLRGPTINAPIAR